MTERKARKEVPALEWVASAIGLLITLGVLGVIGWEAASGDGEAPPAIALSVERVTETDAGYVVEVMAANRSDTTAAGVEIQGKLARGGETSGATIDYVPGRSERGAGLFFTQDPRAGGLELRALGYEEP